MAMEHVGCVGYIWNMAVRFIQLYMSNVCTVLLDERLISVISLWYICAYTPYIGMSSIDIYAQ